MTGALLLGEAPNHATLHAPHLWLRPDESGIPHAANRLRDIAGWTTEEYLRVFRIRDNVMHSIPTRWSAIERGEARARATRSIVAAALAGIGMVVCLGRRAATAAGLYPNMDSLTWHGTSLDDGDHVVHLLVAHLPHPSLRNEWWRAPKNLEAGREFLRSISCP